MHSNDAGMGSQLFELIKMWLPMFWSGREVNVKKLLEEEKIKNPDPIFRTAPFWAWNGKMTKEDIEETIREIKKAGFGGAFVHPRPGLTNEYLSDEWFELWEIALKSAKKEGLMLYIYDENTYPTGYAGGHIISQLPDCAARSVKVRLFETYESLQNFQTDPVIPEETRKMIRLYKAERISGSIRISEEITEQELSEPGRASSECIYIGISMETPYASAWFAGFPNTDILRPEVTKALLDCTYNEYSKQFQTEFGRSIPAIFSDEPGITPGNVWLEDPMAFPFSRFFASEFYRRRGYTFEDNMVCIPLDMEKTPEGRPAGKVRFDYYCTLRELWAENFASPVSKWCEEHNIAWTGHFLDEHWPYPWGGCAPAVMSMYEYMQWPGIDMLMSHMLKEDGKTPMLISVKELESAGRQFGKERLLCECYGAGGWDASISDFKRIGDWLAIHGINFFNQHLWLHSLTGIRKHEHPQSFDFREPWWEEYKHLSEYYARLSYLMSQGSNDHRMLILNPVTSWFMKYPAQQKGDILWKYSDIPEDDPVKTFIEFLQLLNERQTGFDLGDEFILQRHGKIEGSELRVGQVLYNCIVIPSEMRNILSSTADLIEKAVRAGVRVIYTGELPGFIDGEACRPLKWNAEHVNQEELLGEIERGGWKIFPVYGEGIECNYKVLESSEHLLCLSNSTPKKRSCTVGLPGTKIWEINLFTGEKTERFIQISGETRIELNPYELIVLYWMEENTEFSLASKNKVEEQALLRPNINAKELEPEGIHLKSDNVLVLDYGELHLRNKVYKDIYVMAAAEKAYHSCGMEQNPWDMAVQFKRRYVDRDNFEAGSGFTMKFSFEICQMIERLFLVCEHPELYDISVNGRTLTWDKNNIWLDKEFGMLDISGCAVCGQNEILIKGEPFNLMMEIQPVYIIGNFSVDTQQGHFLLKKAKTLKIGGLKDQGVVFYGGRIQYDYRFFVRKDEKAEYYGAAIGDYEASALSLYVNENYAGGPGIGMGDELNITPWVKEGENRLRIELSCSLKNVFGPFHTHEKIRNSAWPGAWKEAPGYGRPASWEYDTIDYGLKENPVLKWR